MKENIWNIEKAANYESAIEIIPKERCDSGVLALKFELTLLTRNSPQDFVVIPIMEGGGRMGKSLTDFTGLIENPMKMSHYDLNNTRISEPRCEYLPDIHKIIVGEKVKTVILAEGVVESEATVIKAMDNINKMIDIKSRGDGKYYPYPIYRTYALISKIAGDPTIPNFTYAFWVNPDIWVHGWGVDNGEKGRDVNNIMGVLSPYAKIIPQKPYFKTTSIYDRYFMDDRDKIGTMVA